MLSVNPSRTKKIGQGLAREILKDSGSKSLIIGLEGDLGGGKTTFLQGFAKELKIKRKILSPTFVIVRKLDIPRDKKIKSRFLRFYHIDCYRIEKPKDILELDFKKIISDSKNIIAIEWVNRIKKILPERIILIKFKFINRNTREIKIFFPKNYGQR